MFVNDDNHFEERSSKDGYDPSTLTSQVDEDKLFTVKEEKEYETDWIHPRFSTPSWADLIEKEELFQKYVIEEERRDSGKKIFVGGFTFDSLSTDEEKEKRLEALFSCFMVFGDIVRTKVNTERCSVSSFSEPINPPVLL
eukprot:TRINITY_DN1105_c0_g3_i1.p2 TRINITY_DN1105_c0_g3~~TRINITY_DN1105_c0_g3_i1.p2  ORF type:complete len:140 (+),score=38.52 TRINITY_DN1105_c0_g3_i1:111-530(+)